MNNLSSSKGVLDIRKYPNRRYYDATRSSHLTLEEIRDLVRQGYDIQVTDNQTGSDITPKVLTQIILDLDSPKLDLFPAALLAQLIRVNDQLVKGFYEKFFSQALHSFLNYQRLMESQLHQGAILPGMFPPVTAWTQSMLHPFGISPTTEETQNPQLDETATPTKTLATTLADLQAQVASLKAKLEQSDRAAPRRTRKKRKS